MKLILLTCPQCNEPLKPENEDVVTICPQCEQIYQLDNQGITSLNVHFMSGGQTLAKEWLPYWVFQGQVNVSQREAQGGGKGSGEAAEQLWSVPRLLYVPAWDLPMNRVQEIGGQLIQQQPAHKTVEKPSGFRLRPVIITAQDAEKMLEFIILAIEARREDYLKSLTFKMKLGEPQLWALPG